MIVTPQETSLDLDEAAAFLGMHPVTLRERAAARIIPGVKLGKEWRFRVTRLVEYMDAQERAVEGNEECGSTRGARRGGTTTKSVASELENQLGRPINAKPELSQRKLTAVT